MAHHTIKLTYNSTTDTVETDPDPIHLKVGDTATFTSAQGPVNILLLPAGHFSAPEFHSGDQPVSRLQAGPAKLCCGVVINGVVLGFPDHQRFGHQIFPDSTT